VGKAFGVREAPSSRVREEALPGLFSFLLFLGERMSDTLSMPTKLRNILTEMNNLRRAQAQFEQSLAGGPGRFYIEKFNIYIDGLFSFAKFKVGDGVVLGETVNPLPCAWIPFEHFLIKGSEALVGDIDYDEKGFRYGIEFDAESWIDGKGKEHKKLAVKSQFWFYESMLAPINQVDE